MRSGVSSCITIYTHSQIQKYKFTHFHLTSMSCIMWALVYLVYHIIMYMVQGSNLFCDYLAVSFSGKRSFPCFSKKCSNLNWNVYLEMNSYSAIIIHENLYEYMILGILNFYSLNASTLTLVQLTLAALRKSNEVHGVIDFQRFVSYAIHKHWVFLPHFASLAIFLCRYLEIILSRQQSAHTISELIVDLNAIDALVNI